MLFAGATDGAVERYFIVCRKIDAHRGQLGRRIDKPFVTLAKIVCGRKPRDNGAAYLPVDMKRRYVFQFVVITCQQEFVFYLRSMPYLRWKEIEPLLKSVAIQERRFDFAGVVERTAHQPYISQLRDKSAQMATGAETDRLGHLGGNFLWVHGKE